MKNQYCLFVLTILFIPLFGHAQADFIEIKHPTEFQSVLFNKNKLIRIYPENTHIKRYSYLGKLKSFANDSIKLELHRSYFWTDQVGEVVKAKTYKHGRLNKGVTFVKHDRETRIPYKVHVNDIYFIQKERRLPIKILGAAIMMVGSAYLAVGGLELLSVTSFGHKRDKDSKMILNLGIGVTATLLSIPLWKTPRPHRLKYKSGNPGPYLVQ